MRCGVSEVLLGFVFIGLAGVRLELIVRCGASEEVLLSFVFIGLGSVAGVLMRGREPLYIR